VKQSKAKMQRKARSRRGRESMVTSPRESTRMDQMYSARKVAREDEFVRLSSLEMEKSAPSQDQSPHLPSGTQQVPPLLPNFNFKPPDHQSNSKTRSNQERNGDKKSNKVSCWRFASGINLQPNLTPIHHLRMIGRSKVMRKGQSLDSKNNPQ
jgi:hypothetical protein